jgi:hypothetical protein
MEGGNEQSCHKCLFQSRPICDRNTSIGIKGWWGWGSEPIKRFEGVFLFGDGEVNERGGRPKSTRFEVNIAAVGDLVKNDRRIASRMRAESLNLSKTIYSDYERGFGKEKPRARFVPNSLTPEQREDESHPAKTFSWRPMHTKISLTELLREMRPGVLPMTPKQSDGVLNGLVRYPLD